MPRLRERQTGAIVNVPDEKVDAVLNLGHYDKVTETAKKTAAKKTNSK